MTTTPAAMVGASAPIRRNHGIDALRGLSIVFVVLNHIGIRVPLAKTALAAWIPAWLLQRVNYNGYESVFIFFVISGFLITRTSLARWGDLQRIAPRRFYLLRAARIVPSLLLVIALMCLLDWLDVPNFVFTKPGQTLGGVVAAAFGLYLNWYEGMTGWLPGGWGVLWSLSIEEAFYLAFPLLCLTLGRRRWLLVLVLYLLVCSLPYTRALIVDNEVWLEKAYLPGMSAIAIGVLSALLAQRYRPRQRWLAPLLCLLGLAGIGTVLFAAVAVWRVVHDGSVLLLCLSAAVLVLGLHWQAAGARPWRLAWLEWLQSCGRLSYEIYLLHMFSVFGVLGLAGLSGLEAQYGFVWYLPILILSWWSGRCLSRYYAEPCERWLRLRFPGPGAMAATR